MVKEILQKNNENIEKLETEISEGKDTHWILRSMGYGAVEGAVDGLAIVGVMTCLLGVVSMILKKKD